MATDKSIESCFMRGNEYIIIRSGNTPYEATLGIQLLDALTNPLETIELYGDYTPGIFVLQGVERAAIRFTYWNDKCLKLRYTTPAKRVWKATPGVHYRNRLTRRHLIIEVN